MKWNKAGRPRKNPDVLEQTVPTCDNKYTRDELRVYKDPVRALAAAVVKQWKEDGCPKNDAEGIKPWVSIIQDSGE